MRMNQSETDEIEFRANETVMQAVEKERSSDERNKASGVNTKGRIYMKINGVVHRSYGEAAEGGKYKFPAKQYRQRARNKRRNHET